MSPRVIAFSWHLGCSAFMAFFAVAFVFYVWYPAPLHTALGVTDVFVVMLLVDVMIGPFLTLLVYKANKRTLLLDMGVIVLLQVSALVYGVWTVAEGRPAWMVFNVDRFDLVQVFDIDSRLIDEAADEYRNAPWFGPVWVGAVKPESFQQRNKLLFESVMGGADIAQRPDLYRPLHELSAAMAARALSMSELNNYNGVESVERTLAEWPDADAWLPLMARVKPMVVLLSRSNGRVLGVADLNPW